MSKNSTVSAQFKAQFKDYSPPIFHTLSDRRVVIIRPILPESKHDQDGFLGVLDRLTPDELYLRFFSRKKIEDDSTRKELVRQFVSGVDGKRHVCFVAEDCETETIQASARYILCGASSAELAITVAPDIRRNGVARLLISALAFDALHQSEVPEFITSVHYENVPMKTLLRERLSHALSSQKPDPDCDGTQFLISTKKAISSFE